MSEIAEKSVRRGRSARRTARVEASAVTQPYISRNIPIMELCSEEGLEILERNADIILQETGIEFRDDGEVLNLWRDAGAEVDGERVRFPKGLLRQLLKTAPSEFTQHARNPKRSVVMGGGI